MSKKIIKDLNPVTVIRGRIGKNKSSTLKKNITFTEKDVILKYINRSRMVPYRDNKGKYLHVSDLLKRCIRKICLYNKLNILPPCETVMPSMGIVHSTGHGIQDSICEYINSGEELQLFGSWYCYCGHTTRIGTKLQVKSKKFCKYCGGETNKFGDLLIKDEELKLVGAVDMPIMKDGGLILGECKSMTVKQWEGLSRPLPEHVLQVMMYWYILNKKNTVKLHDKVFVLYVRKEYQFSSPYKEFLIKPSMYDNAVLDTYIQEAKSYVKYIKDGVLPKRISCDTRHQKRAINCIMADVCFSYE